MQDNNLPKQGSLLISKPLIGDGFFEQSVVLLTEHNENGTLGFTLNKESGFLVGDFIDEYQGTSPVIFGGPVEQDAMFYLHDSQEIIDSTPVGNGYFLGGNFEAFQTSLINDPYLRHRIFLGYSGWSPGQLEGEIDDQTWFVINDPSLDPFELDTNAWRDYMKKLGGEYLLWANAPEDPWMN